MDVIVKIDCHLPTQYYYQLLSQKVTSDLFLMIFLFLALLFHLHSSDSMVFLLSFERKT